MVRCGQGRRPLTRSRLNHSRYVKIGRSLCRGAVISFYSPWCFVPVLMSACVSEYKIEVPTIHQCTRPWRNARSGEARTSVHILYCDALNVNYHRWRIESKCVLLLLNDCFLMRKYAGGGGSGKTAGSLEMGVDICHTSTVTIYFVPILISFWFYFGNFLTHALKYPS